jgi:serine/threonine protein kinase
MPETIVIPPSENHDDPIVVNKKKMIGYGAFGKVYEVYFGDDKENPYALKVIPKQENLLKIIKNEHDIIQLLNKTYPSCTDYLLCYIDIASDEKNIYLLSEKFDHDLIDFIEVSNYGLKPTIERVNLVYGWILQTLFGLEALHAVNIIHRDIKPENILTDKKGNKSKLADFGLSCVKDKCEGFVGSLPYVHPNVIFQKPEDLKWLKVYDLYSTAVMAYELLFDSLIDSKFLVELQQLQKEEQRIDPNSKRFSHSSIIKLLNQEFKNKISETGYILKEIMDDPAHDPKTAKNFIRLLKFIKKFLNPKLTDTSSITDALKILS